MKNATILILSLAVLPIIPSCTKKDVTQCTAGNGGSITLVVSPKHHTKSVKPHMAYLKYNSKDAPSSLADYDLTVTADPPASNFRFLNLKCGDYYIFATGYDSAISASVKGGVPYSISENASGEVSVDVPVTE